MDFLPQELENYVLAHSAQELDILHQLNRETHLKVNKPRMLSGHLQGNFLQMISMMMRPQFILEIGTYTGYSAICLAQGLAENGVLHTVDNNPEHESIIRKYVQEAGLEDKIYFHLGNAADTIPTLLDADQEWDLVFIDADKTNYGLYYDLVFPKVRKGGLIMADNVLWSGKVIQPVKSTDKDTHALLNFNRKVHEDVAVYHTLLPLRDGLMMAIKK